MVMQVHAGHLKGWLGRTTSFPASSEQPTERSQLARPGFESGAGRYAAPLPGAGQRVSEGLAAMVDLTFNLRAIRLRTSTLRRRVNLRD